MIDENQSLIVDDRQMELLAALEGMHRYGTRARLNVENPYVGRLTEIAQRAADNARRAALDDAGLTLLEWRAKIGDPR